MDFNSLTPADWQTLYKGALAIWAAAASIWAVVKHIQLSKVTSTTTPPSTNSTGK